MLKRKAFGDCPTKTCTRHCIPVMWRMVPIDLTLTTHSQPFMPLRMEQRTGERSGSGRFLECGGDRSVKLLDPVELKISDEKPAGLEGVNQIRVPEMYLIAAEAALENEPETARKYLDELARSRGLEQFNDALTLEGIEKEWRRELVQEGQVWFLMKRRHPEKVVAVYNGEEIIMTEDKWQLLIPDDEFEFREDFTM